MDEINIKLHIIDKKIKLYLSFIYYNPLCKLKMKNKINGFGMIVINISEKLVT